MKTTLEMNPRKRDTETRNLKVSNMQIEKLTEKEKIIVRYWWENMLKVLTGEE